ncbi:MAG: hypothetical protein LBV43_01145 [Prevotella sp.]|jgi:hypothetical protein|nr:hypothetical protein [Prevotella sp.]
MSLKDSTILYLIFFKSTLLMSIGFAIPFSFIAMSNGFIETEDSYPFLQLISSFLRMCCLAGFPISLLYKEFTKKQEYYFYYNAGLSKVNLIVVTFILYILLSIIIYCLCSVIWNNI